MLRIAQAFHAVHDFFNEHVRPGFAIGVNFFTWLAAKSLHDILSDLALAITILLGCMKSVDWIEKRYHKTKNDPEI